MGKSSGYSGAGDEDVQLTAFPPPDLEPFPLNLDGGSVEPSLLRTEKPVDKAGNELQSFTSHFSSPTYIKAIQLLYGKCI